MTEAETRVAALIGSGHSAPQAAALLAVSIPTVKTHLSHCFDKTGVRTQVELARLMSLLPGHLLSLVPPMNSVEDAASGLRSGLRKS